MLKINISNLDEGVHDFDFVVAPGEIEIDDIEISEDIDVKAKLYKSGNQLCLKIDIKGRIILSCDRCIENYDYDLNSSFQLIYKVDFSGSAAENNDDDIKFISANTRFIDLHHDVRDYIILSVPLRKVPDENEGICSFCKRDVSKIFEINRRDEINPVWEKLLKAKTK